MAPPSATPTLPSPNRWHISFLLNLILVTRVLLACLILLLQVLFPSYDQSTPLFFPATCSSSADALVIQLVSPLLRWDALYFLSIARDGYELEKQHAFYPLYPAVVRAASGATSALLPLCPATSIALTALVLNQLLFVPCVLLLYSLVRRLSSARVALMSAALLVVSPATVFLVAPYTECVFLLLSLCGFHLYERGWLLPASAVFALTAATRSNGVLYAVFPCWTLLTTGLRWWKGGVKAAQVAYQAGVVGACIGLIFAPSVGYNLWSARPYCDLASSLLPLPPYCDTWYPSMYSYIQQHYWGVGFLRYYTLTQLPNFVLAGPMIGLSCAVLWSGWSRGAVLDVRGVWGPYVVLHGIMLGVGLTVLHVQVMTRFMSALPTVYVWMAELWMRETEGKGREMGRIRWWLYWCVGYMTLGTVLFTLFLPWT